jgi:dihydroorotase
VLAFLNIVGYGMRGPKFENDVADMQPAPAADMAKRYKGLIVGFKSAHFAGLGWTYVERAVEAGTMAGIPVMVNSARTSGRPLYDLLLRNCGPATSTRIVIPESATALNPAPPRHRTAANK